MPYIQDYIRMRGEHWYRNIFTTLDNAKADPGFLDRVDNAIEIVFHRWLIARKGPERPFLETWGDFFEHVRPNYRMTLR